MLRAWDPADPSLIEARHVVVAASDTVIDGVGTLGGRANGSGDDGRGGGIFIGSAANVLLTEVDVGGGWSAPPSLEDAYGGGIYVGAGGSVELRDSNVLSNAAAGLRRLWRRHLRARCGDHASKSPGLCHRGEGKRGKGR